MSGKVNEVVLILAQLLAELCLRQHLADGSIAIALEVDHVTQNIGHPLEQARYLFRFFAGAR